MKPIVVSDILAVGEVPSPEQFEILAKAGFKSVINNQPDGEVDRLPGNAVLAAAAKKHGLAYAYAPLANRTPEPHELEAYSAALHDLAAPVFAFCYSGARSAAGCALLLTETQEPDAIVAQFAEAGHDVSSLKPWLVDERKRRAKPAPKTASNGNGNGAHAAKEAPAVAVPPPAVTAPKAVEGIVVHARAAGYGGFAM
jgi:uncharacterized protein (TIGR01244 family)